MPATNYNWTLNDQPPIFQVYGTKRKGSPEKSSQEHGEEGNCKRRCTEAHVEDMQMTDDMETTSHQKSEVPRSQLCHPLPQQLHGLTSPAHRGMSGSTFAPQPPMHSNFGIQQLAQHHLQVTMNNRVPPLLDATGDHMVCNNNNNNNNNTFVPSMQQFELNNNDITSQSNNQNEMQMDLHDGAYSTATLPTNAQTDAEYEAACSMVASMEAEGAPNPQQYSMTYCDQFCVGGNLSPSGKVRCYCKPSWEGLMDMRPYVSDYY